MSIKDKQKPHNYLLAENMSMIFELDPLVERLAAEDHGDYLYRGQTKKYSAPLVPSLFRPMVGEKQCLGNKESHSLRNIKDASFVETLVPDEVKAILSETTLKDYSNRLYINDVLIKHFGYPLAQSLSQQAGLWSEGLDVTTDLSVAVFFATHQYDFNSDSYILANKGEGVIYRWPIKREGEQTLHSLKNTDFYSCPIFLNSKSILDSFQQCNDVQESTMFLYYYMMVKFWGPKLKINGVKLNIDHPFDLLKLPRDAILESRITKQSAGLLIPDQLLNEYWISDHIKKKAIKEIVHDGKMCIEDLSRSRSVCVYDFSHREQNNTLTKFEPNSIFPRNDFSCIYVRDWINAEKWDGNFDEMGLARIIGTELKDIEIIFDGVEKDPEITRLLL